jgi:hypothetical protein
MIYDRTPPEIVPGEHREHRKHFGQGCIQPQKLRQEPDHRAAEGQSDDRDCKQPEQLFATGEPDASYRIIYRRDESAAIWRPELTNFSKFHAHRLSRRTPERRCRMNLAYSGQRSPPTGVLAALVQRSSGCAAQDDRDRCRSGDAKSEQVRNFCGRIRKR